MKLLVARLPSVHAATLGHLFIDGVFECYTLEDELQPDGVKIHGETAIPDGTYPIQITRSPKFGRMLPLIEHVPGFEGIRIHPGNTALDTEGCLLVGDEHNGVTLVHSRDACDRVQAKLAQAQARQEPITIQFVNPVLSASV